MKTTHRIVLTDKYIADAQRLAIARNKALKLVYQTWWAWWLPRVGFVGLIIVGVAIHFDLSLIAWSGVFIVLSFFLKWAGRRGLAKARERTRFKGSTTTVVMDENGVDAVGEAGNTHAKWSGILPPAIYPNGVMFKYSRFAMIWLPDQALVEGTPEDVRKLLAENVRDPGAKVSGVPK